MKAYYKTILRGDSANSDYAFNEKPEDVYEYVLLEMTEPCCQEMKEALEDDAIRFGEFGSSFLNRDCNVNFADCRPYPEGAVWDEYPIHFCPFCGQKVETEERERVTRKRYKKEIPSQEVDDYLEERI
jgi:hypothetical protein